MLKTTMEMVPLINIVTGQHSNNKLLGQNKLIFDQQRAYDKAKELVADL